MKNRETILNAVRSHSPAPTELPSLQQAWVRYDDPFAQFKLLLESVGGQCVSVASQAQVIGVLAAIPEYAAAKQIVSRIPAVPGNVDLDAIDDPHELEPVDWAVLSAEFGVAENGAVWVTDAQLKHRVIYFICQHLALVLPKREIVHNMHEAYTRITVGASSLGLFLSGPSKTAGMEQFLVIGAHGPRSLTVICVE